MRICFVNSEIFSQFTGYSRLNRIVGRELVRRGIEVFVLVPQVEGKKRIEHLDGMTVVSFPARPPSMLFAGGLFRLPEADIYEIWDPYFLFSWLATRATRDALHTVVFADPHEQSDYWRILSVDRGFREARRRTGLKIPYSLLYLYLRFIRPRLANSVLRAADAYFYEAKFLLPKVDRMHNLKSTPVFVPHIAEIPDYEPVKAPEPTVCFLAHWGVKKRPERFLELARCFPNVRFVQMGGTNDLSRREMVLRTASQLPNVEVAGVVNEDEKARILDRSWILANTSIHEGLPQAFIEACTRRCAILSTVNPDDYASNFGYNARDDDYEAGLEYLLENDRWKEKGQRGFEYTKETNSLDKVIERRIQVYESLMAKR